MAIKLDGEKDMTYQKENSFGNALQILVFQKNGQLDNEIYYDCQLFCTGKQNFMRTFQARKRYQTRKSYLSVYFNYLHSPWQIFMANVSKYGIDVKIAKNGLVLPYLMFANYYISFVKKNIL